ncbi:MAG TPA: Rnf-Nqr domain containing protein, partial [Gammaproteobacteria bacterium]
MGVGFLAVLVLLGALREIIGFGTLFANAELMFGEGARGLTIAINPDYPGFLLAILPPGAFFGLAILIVIKNWFDLRPATRPAGIPAAAESA